MALRAHDIGRSSMAARAFHVRLVGSGLQSSRHVTRSVKAKAFKKPTPTPVLRTNAATARATSSTASPAVAAPTVDIIKSAANGLKPTTDVGLVSSPTDDQQRMSWTKQWWPIAVEDSLDPYLLHKETLLGKDLVLWRTADGVWSCLDNACPHRGAPLDQGRLQGNCLQCAYHGWEFAADGSCKEIPQSTDPGKFCSMKAAQAGSYPVRAAQGLLWVWGESGAAAAEEAAATPLKSCPDVEDSERYIWRFPWLGRNVMVSYDYGLDNFFDISHAPFAHDGVFGITAEQNEPDLPLEIEVTKQNLSLLTVPSTKPDEQGAARRRSTDRAQLLTFTYPVMATADNYQINSAGQRTKDLVNLVVYRTPVRPGMSKVFYNMLLGTKMDPKQRQAAMGTPAWDIHAQMLRFFDGDLVLMHDQERLVANKGGWKKGMFMPHSSDNGVSKFRAWFDKAGPIPYAGDTSLGPIQPRHVVLNHWEQHCKTCKSCQEGVRLLKRLEYGCYAAGVLAGLISLKFAELSPSGSTAADLADFLVPYLGLTAAAALVFGGTKVKQYVQDNFFFRDYNHSRSGN